VEYIYQCKECGKEFSVVGRFETLVGLKPECPECKSSNVVKKLFATPSIFKGDGFYSTKDRKETSE
jgi:putative FmdB family regulatory protein